ncbi:MAG: hypothetical protein ACTHV1_06500, partial [Flaviflexus sp.]
MSKKLWIATGTLGVVSVLAGTGMAVADNGDDVQRPAGVEINENNQSAQTAGETQSAQSTVSAVSAQTAVSAVSTQSA